MTRVVYIDVLFCINLIINYLIIRACAKINSQTVKTVAACLASALGGVYSMTILLPELPELANAVIKLLMSATIVAMAFGVKKLRPFLRQMATFYIISFAFAGCMTALWFCFKPNGMLINNGVVYFDLSPAVLILSSVISYVVITAVMRLINRNRAGRRQYQIEFSFKERSVSVTALLDTGNALTDIFTNVPVVIVEYSVMKSVLPAEVREAFQNASLQSAAGLDPYWERRYRLIPHRTVSGTGILPAAKPDSFYITDNGRRVKVHDVVIAVSRDLGGDHSALIGPDILKQTETEMEKCAAKSE